MKKKLILLLGLVMSLSLVACGNDTSDTEATEAAESEVTEATTEEREKDESEEETEKAEETEELPSVELTKATSEDVEAALESGLVIDTRAPDAYIGWKLDGAKRGGHIEGATDFSVHFLEAKYDEKNNLEGRSRDEVLDEMLKNKGIEKGKDIVLYDINGEDAQKVGDFLASKGIENIKYYNASEWIDDEAKPMASYPNYEMLLSPTALKDIMDGKEVEELGSIDDYKIFDVSWGTVEESGYLDGHIPGAVHVHTDWFEPEEQDIPWMLDNDEGLIELAEKLGIKAGDKIITTGPEPMASSRFAVICKNLGAEDVKLLNGGLLSWQTYGYELETDNNEPVAVEDFGADAPLNKDVIETPEQVQEYLKRDDYTLVDIRTREEYDGENTGYSYHDKAGRIDGAVFGYAGINNSSSMSYYRNIDKTMRNGYEILDMLEGQDINLDNHLSFMCGSGWRAAETYWYANVMGLENTSLYSDGWIGWSERGLPSIEGSGSDNQGF